MTTDVSLGTYILPTDHKVWKYFPGKSYKFYDLVGQTSIALIDVRDLQEIDVDPKKWTDDALLEHISEDRVQRRVDSGARRPTRLVRSQGDDTGPPAQVARKRIINPRRTNPAVNEFAISCD